MRKVIIRRAFDALKELINIYNPTQMSEEAIASTNPQVVRVETENPYRPINTLPQESNDFIERRPVAISQDGTKYQGEWNSVKNTREGIGTQVWPDGRK